MASRTVKSFWVLSFQELKFVSGFQSHFFQKKKQRAKSLKYWKHISFTNCIASREVVFEFFVFKNRNSRHDFIRIFTTKDTKNFQRLKKHKVYQWCREPWSRFKFFFFKNRNSCQIYQKFKILKNLSFTKIDAFTTSASKFASGFHLHNPSKTT